MNRADLTDLTMWRVQWWKFIWWFRRCPECHARGYGGEAPRWESDKVAQMLGIAQYGCPCCGKGAIEARDRALEPQNEAQDLAEPTTRYNDPQEPEK